MNEWNDLAKRVSSLVPRGMSEDQAYELGKDCARNGANETNCNFRIFAKPEWTRAWERGKAVGDSVK